MQWHRPVKKGLKRRRRMDDNRIDEAWRRGRAVEKGEKKRKRRGRKGKRKKRGERENEGERNVCWNEHWKVEEKRSGTREW